MSRENIGDQIIIYHHVIDVYLLIVKHVWIQEKVDVEEEGSIDIDNMVENIQIILFVIKIIYIV